ncbi:MAG TPA: type II/IV secretion system ATPase subunit [Candidatus Thermoplasmatota archaeon]|nr:type II/IV secretion system ATPase subunit [Candidatus Thermoplasmatota archaeon]
MDDEEGGSDPPSLSERLRNLKVRDAGEADPESLARAASNKATLSERMKGLLGGEAETGHPAPVGRSPVGAAPPASADGPSLAAAASPPEDDAVRFSDRLRTLQKERALPTSAAASAAPATPAKRRGLWGWFLGRDVQERGKGAVTTIPPIDAATWSELEFYPVEPPYSFVRILQDRKTGELLYDVLEPQLTAAEREILEFVQDALVRGLDIDPSGMRSEDREAFLLEAVRGILRDYRIRLDTVAQARVEYFLRRDFLGLGPIHPVMVDPGIEDISCDGPAEPLFVFHRAHESLATSIRFKGDAELDGFVIRLAQRSGKAISISDPILDAALPDGSRLQATLGKEVTQNGSTFTIRRFKPDPFTPIDLVRFGTMSIELLAWFWMIVQHGHSLVLSGGTASGKTTALNVISQFIPPTAKVVSIEDTREVNLPHKNWIKSVTRSGSTSEGTGEIGMFELLKASLRQRPEYILVGEVRGIEATVAFQAMATGHTVFSTMHADSARSVVYRLENDPINIPRLVLQALDIIAIQAQVRVKGKRVRRIKEVVELVGMDPSTKELLTNTVFRWEPGADRFEMGPRSYILERIAAARSWSREQAQAEFERRKRLLQLVLDTGVKDVRAFTELVKAYYRDPDGLVRQLQAQRGTAP